jgi:hypothetical protein
VVVMLSGCKLQTGIFVLDHVKTEGSQFRLGVMRHPLFSLVVFGYFVFFCCCWLTDLKIRPQVCVRFERIDSGDGQ